MINFFFLFCFFVTGSSLKYGDTLVAVIANVDIVRGKSVYEVKKLYKKNLIKGKRFAFNVSLLHKMSNDVIKAL